MDAVNRYSGLAHPVQDTLFLEFHGSASSVREDAALVQQIASELGGGAFAWAVGHEARGQLWAARHNAAYANKALLTGCGMWATDV